MRRALLLTWFFAALALTPEEALAQGRPSAGRGSGSASARPANKVGVQIYVVHATDSESGVDPRLSALSSSFRYFKYKGYRLLSTQDADVSVGEDHSFPIEGNRRLKVTLIEKDDKRARVRVEMSSNDGKLLDTTVSINRGGTFIVAGPKYKDGILMLPVQADY